jgi:hypothetical protein
MCRLQVEVFITCESKLSTARQRETEVILATPLTHCAIEALDKIDRA